MLELNYVKGDDSPQELMRLIESTTGLPQDLTGKAVALKVRRLGESEYFQTVDAVVTDAANGRLTITWPAASFTEPGKQRADVVLSAVDFVQTVRDAVSITVRDRP